MEYRPGKFERVVLELMDKVDARSAKKGFRKAVEKALREAYDRGHRFGVLKGRIEKIERR